MLNDYIFTLLAQAPPATNQPAVESLPLAAHILAVLGLGCGLVLWLVGQRVLKPVLGVLGAVFGGLLGFFLMPSIGPESLANVPSPYVGLGLGALFGLGAGLLLFRFALAAITGLALGMAGILIGAAAVHFQPIQDAPRTLGALGNTTSQAAVAAREVKIGKDRTATVESARPLAVIVKDFVTTQTEEIRGHWSRLPGHDQVALALCGVGGVAAGLFCGLFFPKKSGAVSTALFGSAVWIPSLLWIVNALEVPGRHHLDRGTVFWLIVWGVVALLGLIVQINSENREAPKAAT